MNNHDKSKTNESLETRILSVLFSEGVFKKMFLKISQSLHENIYTGVSFLEKRPRHRYFLWILQNFKTTFLIERLRRTPPLAASV